MAPTNRFTRSRFRNWLAYLFSAAAALFMVLLVLRDAEQFRTLLDLSPSLLLIIIGLLLLPDRALVNYVLLRELGARVSMNESYGLSVVTTLGNQLPFAGGIMIKGAFLKRKYDLAYSKYLSASAALFVFAISGAGLIGLAGSTYLLVSANEIVPLAFPAGFAIMTISPFLLLMPRILHMLPTRWRSYATRFFEGMVLLTEEPIVSLKLILLLAAGIVLFAVRLWLSYQLISTEVSLIYCIFFASATVLSHLISIAPGGLGVREGIVAGMGLLIGVEPSVSVVAVGIERLITIATIGVLGIYYGHYFGKNVIGAVPSSLNKAGIEGEYTQTGVE